MTPLPNKVSVLTLSPSLKRWGWVIFINLGQRRVRIGILIVALGLLAYLLYANVWWQLRQSAPLPLGVSAEPPSLATESFNAINEARLIRSGRGPRSFAQFATLFQRITTQTVPR